MEKVFLLLALMSFSLSVRAMNQADVVGNFVFVIPHYTLETYDHQVSYAIGLIRPCENRSPFIAKRDALRQQWQEKQISPNDRKRLMTEYQCLIDLAENHRRMY